MARQKQPVDFVGRPGLAVEHSRQTFAELAGDFGAETQLGVDKQLRVAGRGYADARCGEAVMPRIQTYEAPDNLGLRPTEQGIAATANAARRVEGNYREAAGAAIDQGRRIASTIDVVGDVATKAITHSEVSNGARAFAELQDGITRRWNEAIKDPKLDAGNPVTAEKFRQEVIEPALSKFEGAFLTEGGQNFARSHISSLREHMFRRTAADMSRLAGISVANNIVRTTNTLVNNVYSDPSALDFARDTLKSSLGGMVDTSPTLTPEQAAEVKTKLAFDGEKAIVRAAIEGAIAKGADWRSIADNPAYAQFIDRAEITGFEQRARVYQNSIRSEERSQRAERENQAKVEFHSQVNELRGKTMPQEVGARPTLPPDYWQQVRKLMQHPGAALEPSLLKQLMTEGDAITNRLNKPEPKEPISRATTIELLRRIRATDSTRIETPDEIYKAFDENKLTSSDFNFLNRELSNTNTPEGRALARERNDFFKRYTPQIDPTLGVGGLEGEKMYLAEMDARRAEADLRRQNLDPHLVYTPGTQWFFGRPENLAKYRPTAQERTDYAARQKALRDGTVQPDDNSPRAFVPPASWQWSPSRRQYRDPATNTVYDAAGKQVR